MNCVWRYVLAYIFIKHSAKFEAPECELIPRPNTNNEPWQGLADLRHSLLERGMVRHANGLFKVEVNRTPLTKRLQKWAEFEHVPALLSDPRSRYHAQADMHRRLCEDYISLHNVGAAQEEADACGNALDEMLRCPDVESRDDRHERLHLQLVRLDFIENSAKKLYQVEALLIDMRSCAHQNLGPCLDLAAETALKIWQDTGSKECLSKFFNLRRELEHLDEVDHEDLVSLQGHQYDIHSQTVQDKVDTQKCLEWIDGFFTKYPSFAAPGTMASLFTQKSILLRGLQRLDEAKEAHKKAQEWHQRAGNAVKLYHQSNSNILAPGPGPVGATEYDSEDDSSGGYAIVTHYSES